MAGFFVLFYNAFTRLIETNGWFFNHPIQAYNQDVQSYDRLNVPIY